MWFSSQSLAKSTGSIEWSMAYLTSLLVNIQDGHMIIHEAYQGLYSIIQLSTQHYQVLWFSH